MPRTAPETLEAFELRADAAMAHVLRALPTLPILPGDDYKYSEETVQPCHGAVSLVWRPVALVGRRRFVG